MKKLFAVASILFMVTIFAVAHDGSPGLRHQHQFVLKKDFVQVDFVNVSRGTNYSISTAGTELGKTILEAEFIEFRLPVLNDGYRYRSQKWIRYNNIEVKANHDKIFESNLPASLRPVKLC